MGIDLTQLFADFDLMEFIGILVNVIKSLLGGLAG